MTPDIMREALDRDRVCVFSGVAPSQDSDALVVTWIFPPFLGYTVGRRLICALELMLTAIVWR